MTDVSINHFTFHYPQSDVKVLNDINLTFKSHHFSLLSGPSGSGKSTLLYFIAGLYPHFIGIDAVGEIKFGDTNIKDIPREKISQSVAMMFQNPNQQFAMDTVVHEMTFVLENLRIAPDKMDNIINDALEFCGIKRLRSRVINTLSGGEKQRVALACIVAMDPQVIVLDEPFASIDPGSREDLINKLKLLQQEHGKTIILADHDLTSYRGLVDEFYYLDPDTHQISLLDDQQAEHFFKNFESTQQMHKRVEIPTGDDHAIIKLSDFKLEPHASLLLTLNHFDFYKEKTTLITGANGIGKSTLFNALTKLLPYKGTIVFDGKDIQKIRPLPYAKKVTLLFQDAENQFLNITVKEELDLSLANRTNTDYTQADVDDMLSKLDMAGKDDRIVYSLSEGQKKKLQIIEMLIMNPPVLLMDEPFKGLDYHSLEVVVGFLNRAKNDFHQTQIIISHQLSGLDTLIDYHAAFEDQNLTYQEVIK
ncbi:ABC transporter ATP-binding protein [Lentilactobacillus buchneri]|uniref:ABC transporter domain-containing protein n=1 Tax=Lentilactobacillus buchneri DSM 20057 TaxID=1423728 RepID=A0A4R5NQB5_LENBU|nr:ABC transporter ATP-binding protein [Lentilactobacillus buchneri]AEB74209.1 Polyamine-transporting ATPase., Peptide-transporting ATPase [Lentilactobacillus buchneri NRRL B-30929]KRK67749.1 polyamine-transporting ATPase [Lentilactobacillus buchneri DSM 20057]MCT2881709.1 ABC transporter ATP-binding protein [Lentilactobacillus buchneri]MCT3253531.1 ABC transporter ATP-binding protein [Lentilactobacillus buchneri]MCT3548122.1 ABC transporter ATP-binding protein [Lentilactobacillus buchneri]